MTSGRIAFFQLLESHSIQCLFKNAKHVQFKHIFSVSHILSMSADYQSNGMHFLYIHLQLFCPLKPVSVLSIHQGRVKKSDLGEYGLSINCSSNGISKRLLRIPGIIITAGFRIIM